jgi:hypothetical protein
MADEQAEYAFKVSDAIPAGIEGFPLGKDPFIWLEPVHGALSILKGSTPKTLGLVLRPGASQQEADQIADYLNHHIQALTVW